MSSGWGAYYVLFLASGLAIGIPLLFTGIFHGIVRRRSSGKGSSFLGQKKATHLTSKRVNTRFFIAVNSSLILLSMALILIPCVVSGTTEGKFGAIASVSLFLALGLFYSVRKGDLGWLKSFRGNREGTKGRIE